MYHRQSIELWLYEEFFGLQICSQSFQYLLASTTLVDFPQFRDTHHLIPLVLNIRPNNWASPAFTIRQGHDIKIGKNLDKWEIYVEYRKIVSQFLIDQTRSEIPRDPRFSCFNFLCWSRGGKEHYVGLAKHLLSFLSKCQCHW